jgi:hypothetical protein
MVDRASRGLISNKKQRFLLPGNLLISLDKREMSNCQDVKKTCKRNAQKIGIVFLTKQRQPVILVATNKDVNL